MGSLMFDSTRAPALTTAALIAVAATAPVRALDDVGGETERRLLACDQISAPAEKLACFDAVVESLSTPPVEPAVSPPPATPPRPAPSDSISPAEPGEARARREDVTTARREDTPEDDGNSEGFQATIVRVWENFDGRFSVELDNGQVWRETQGTRVGMPAEGDSVEVSKGIFGSYRMKIESITPIARVRRTK